MLTDADLDAIAARAAAAPRLHYDPDDWRNYIDDTFDSVLYDEDEAAVVGAYTDEQREYYLHAADDLRALLAALREARAFLVGLAIDQPCPLCPARWTVERRIPHDADCPLWQAAGMPVPAPQMEVRNAD